MTTIAFKGSGEASWLSLEAAWVDDTNVPRSVVSRHSVFGSGRWEEDPPVLTQSACLRG